MGPETSAAALAELFQAHHDAVLRACRAYLRDDTEAEDAAQETFLAAHRSLQRGAVPDHPKAWLLAIAHNTCWRRLQRRPADPLPLDAAEERPDERSDTHAAVVRADAGGALWRAVGELPSRQQDAFVLCEVAGEPYATAAARLDITEPALEALLVRARRRLRTRLRALAGALQWVAPTSWLSNVGGTDPSAATAVVANTGKVGMVPATMKAAAVTIALLAGSSTLVAHQTTTRRAAVPPAHAVRRATKSPVPRTRTIRPAIARTVSPSVQPARVAAHDESRNEEATQQRPRASRGADESPSSEGNGSSAEPTDRGEVDGGDSGSDGGD